MPASHAARASRSRRLGRLRRSAAHRRLARRGLARHAVFPRVAGSRGCDRARHRARPPERPPCSRGRDPPSLCRRSCQFRPARSTGVDDWMLYDNAGTEPQRLACKERPSMPMISRQRPTPTSSTRSRPCVAQRAWRANSPCEPIPKSSSRVTACWCGSPRRNSDAKAIDEQPVEPRIHQPDSDDRSRPQIRDLFFVVAKIGQDRIRVLPDRRGPTTLDRLGRAHPQRHRRDRCR